MWRFLRAAIPTREGVLVLDGTRFPKQGSASVGVARHYSGTLGRVGNCQVAVTAAPWTGVQAWCVGALLYLPQTWLTAAKRARGKIPDGVVVQEKWRLALTLLRQVRAAGITLTAVVADAKFGDCTTLRRTLHRRHLPYTLGVSSTLTVFRGTPTLTTAARLTLAAAVVPIKLRGPWRYWRLIHREAPTGADRRCSPIAGRRGVRLDAGTILFRRSPPLFLDTYPLRWSARRILDRCTRAAGGTARLYVRVSSSVVWSGRSATNRWSTGKSTGECRPRAAALLEGRRIAPVAGTL